MKEISRIPQWLKNLLLVTVVCGTCYFGYTKCFHDNNLEILQEDVSNLHKKVHSIVTVADYNVDIEYIITTIYLMEELKDQVYQVMMANREILLEHLQDKCPDDPNILLIQGRYDRIEYQRNILKQNLHRMIHKVDPMVDENQNEINK